MNIELDITRECNFTCPACNRMCNIYPKNPKSIMSLDEIKNIVSEINNSCITVDLFKIIGGEPSTHPNLDDICKYINQNLKANKIVLKTNGSNNKYVNNCLKNTKIKFLRDEWNIDTEDTKKCKVLKHINIYNIDNIVQLLNYNDYKKYDNCTILNQCGVNIYKFNNKIRYALCTCTSYISRLLCIEDKFTYSSLNELLKSDKLSHYKEICSHCAMFTNKWFRNYIGENVTKSSNISNCFIDGLNYIKNHPEQYI